MKGAQQTVCTQELIFLLCTWAQPHYKNSIADSHPLRLLDGLAQFVAVDGRFKSHSGAQVRLAKGLFETDDLIVAGMYTPSQAFACLWLCVG